MPAGESAIFLHRGFGYLQGFRYRSIAFFPTQSMRIPAKSAGDSVLNRPPVPVEIGRPGRAVEAG
jgi:hypothetical protein